MPVIGQTSRQSLQPSGHLAVLIVSFPLRNFLTYIVPSGSFASHTVQQGQWSLSMLTVVLYQLRSGSLSVLGFSIGFPSAVE